MAPANPHRRISGSCHLQSYGRRIYLCDPPTGLDTHPIVCWLYLLRPPIGQTFFRRYRNINLLPFAYAFRPRLRIRLTLSGLTLLKETLDLRRTGFSPVLSLLIPASSLPCGPPVLSVWLQSPWNAPLPTRHGRTNDGLHGFGDMLEPRYIIGAESLDQ